jgi:hypothetical protein
MTLKFFIPGLEMIMRAKWMRLSVLTLAVTLISTACAEAPPGVDEALENPTALITTKPLQYDKPLYIDANHDGVYQDDELIDHYVAYDGHQELTVTWQPSPHEAADPAHASYRVMLFQISLDDFIKLIETEDWYAVYFTAIKVAHHWASNPNGRSFTFGSLGFGESVCYNCPTVVVIMPETYELVYNLATDTYEYEYTPVPVEEGYYQSSDVFIFEDTPH